MTITITAEMLAAGEEALQGIDLPSVITRTALAKMVYYSMRGLEPKKARTEKPKSDEPPGFADFYSAYPRKEARRAAAKAYSGALARAAGDAILAGARRYATSRKGEEAKFTKHPATWLNNDCWKDETPNLTIVSGYQSRFRKPT